MGQSFKKIIEFVLVAILAIIVIKLTSFLLNKDFNDDEPGKCSMVKSGESPYHVSILDLVINRYKCSGALISKNYVLTMANCVADRIQEDLYKRQLKVILGTRTLPGGSSYDMEKFTCPDSYDEKTATDSIGVIRLKKEVSDTGNFFRIRPISLPDRGKTPEMKQELLVTSFYMHERTTADNDLRKFPVQVVSIEKCRKFFRTTKVLNFTGKFCAVAYPGYYPCVADSGGPAVDMEKKYIIGMFMFYDNEKCGNRHPNIYVNVSHYLDFIKKAMA